MLLQHPGDFLFQCLRLRIPIRGFLAIGRQLLDQSLGVLVSLPQSLLVRLGFAKGGDLCLERWDLLGRLAKKLSEIRRERASRLGYRS
jgi:hypothetical protein